MVEKQWIYEEEDDHSSRYLLGHVAKRNIICFGINPSTAKPENLDNTLKSVDRVSTRNGYDGWIMLNLYPQRATDPKNIHNKFNKKIHQKNLDIISNNLFDNCTIWAAWGGNITIRSYLVSCLRDIYDLTKEIECSWNTIDDRIYEHPRHPLYLPEKATIKKFDIDLYLKRFKI